MTSVRNGGERASPSPLRDRKARSKWAQNEERFAFLMISPSLLFLMLVFTFPLLYLIGMSTFRIEMARPWNNAWVGLKNYTYMLGDSRFWNSMRITIIYTLSTVVLQVVIGMGLALALSDTFAGKVRALLRVAVLLPMILAPVVVGLAWRTLLLTPKYGLIDFLATVLGFGSQPWLGNPLQALVCVIIIHTWQWTPFAFLVFLASLAALPTEVYEAALIDRANAWQRFWYITLPLLRPSIIIVIIMRLMVALRAFAAIFSATGGGPGTATEILNLFAYRTSFNSLNLGYGATLATTLLLMTTAITILLFRVRNVEV